MKVDKVKVAYSCNFCGLGLIEKKVIKRGSFNVTSNDMVL